MYYTIILGPRSQLLWSYIYEILKYFLLLSIYQYQYAGMINQTETGYRAAHYQSK